MKKQGTAVDVKVNVERTGTAGDEQGVGIRQRCGQGKRFVRVSAGKVQSAAAYGNEGFRFGQMKTKARPAAGGCDLIGGVGEKLAEHTPRTPALYRVQPVFDIFRAGFVLLQQGVRIAARIADEVLGKGHFGKEQFFILIHIDGEFAPENGTRKIHRNPSHIEILISVYYTAR